MRIRFRQWFCFGLPLSALAFGAGACRADELTDKALQAFRTQASELRVTAKSDDELEVTGRGGPLTIYLHNVRIACAANRDRCDDEVSSFVGRAAAIASDGPSAGAFVAERVHAVLRNAAFAKRATGAFKEPDKQLVVLPFVEGIEVLFVIDGEKAVRFVNLGDLAGAGLTDKALLALAASNAARLAPLKHEPVKGVPGLYFMPANDGLGSSRIFDAALWDKLEATVGGAVAVSVPTRDWVLFTRSDQAEQVAKLRVLAGRITRGESYAVSDAVMVRDGKGWKLLQSP
jgi:uncharacterized protein YtpQ (UPF0354 family)